MWESGNNVGNKEGLDNMLYEANYKITTPIFMAGEDP